MLLSESPMFFQCFPSVSDLCDIVVCIYICGIFSCSLNSLSSQALSLVSRPFSLFLYLILSFRCVWMAHWGRGSYYLCHGNHNPPSLFVMQPDSWAADLTMQKCDWKCTHKYYNWCTHGNRYDHVKNTWLISGMLFWWQIINAIDRCLSWEEECLSFFFVLRSGAYGVKLKWGTVVKQNKVSVWFMQK